MPPENGSTNYEIGRDSAMYTYSLYRAKLRTIKAARGAIPIAEPISPNRTTVYCWVGWRGALEAGGVIGIARALEA